MDTQNHQFAELTAITASVVPDELRIGFWPQHFGTIPQWIILEPQIFAWMDRLCTDYHGGIWSFRRSVTVALLWLPSQSKMKSGQCSTA
jgi:hypothetical protein